MQILHRLSRIPLYYLDYKLTQGSNGATMYKTTLLFVTLFLCTLSAKETRYTIKGGFASAKLLGNEFEDDFLVSVNNHSTLFLLNKGNNNGFTGGLGIEHILRKHFSIDTELHLIVSGLNYSGSYNNEKLDIDLNLHYLRLPILFSLDFPTKKSSFSFYTGPSGSFLVNAEEEVQFKTLTKEITDSEEVTNSYRRWNAGLVTGIGFEYKLKKGALTFDFRHHIGFIPLLPYEITSDSDIRDSEIALLVGYSIKGH